MSQPPVSHPPATKATPLNEAVASVAARVQSGAAPSTAQVSNVLDEAKTLLEAKKQEAPLSPKGRKIAEQMKEVLASAQTLLEEKRPLESLQTIKAETEAAGRDLASSDAARQAKQIGSDLSAGAASASAGTAQAAGTLQEQASQAAAATVNAAMDLARELVGSPEFRQTLVDIIGLLQQALQETAESIVQGTQEATARLEQAKEQVRSESPGTLAQRTGTEARQQAQKAAATVQQQVASTTEAVKGKAAELAERARTAAADVATGRVAPLDVVELSPERREELRARFDALLQRLAGVPSSRRAFSAIFQIVEQWRALLAETLPRAEATAEQAKAEVAGNEHVRRAWAEAKAFVERWTEGRSLDPLLTHARALYDAVAADPDLRAWWAEVQAYAREALDTGRQVAQTAVEEQQPRAALEQARAATEARRERLNELLDRGRRLYAGRTAYRQELEALLAEGRALLSAARNDRAVQRLVSSVRALAQTLFLDTRGNPTLKPEELRQFRILLASLLMEEFKYVPVPRIEGSTADYDFAVQNISFYGFDLLPEHLLLKVEARADLNAKEATATAVTNFKIAATNIQCAMKNVMFWFRKKSGLIRMEDAGIADLSIGGRGASLTIELEYDGRAEGTSGAGLVTRSVRCNLDKLVIKVIDSRYDWLLNLLEPFFANDVKRSIEREVEHRIRATVDAAFNNVRSVLPETPAALKGAGEALSREVHDLQRTKDRLQVEKP